MEDVYIYCPLSHRTARKEYITAKYMEHKFCRRMCSSGAEKQSELLEAVKSRDLLALIQVYAEGVEILEPLLESGQVRLITPVAFDTKRGLSVLVPPLL